MARFRSSMALRPVHRIKHVVDSSATVAAAAVNTIDLIITKDAPVITGTAECETGSKCYGIYLKVLVASNEAISLGAIPNVYMTISKNPGHALAVEPPNSVGDSDLKKYVIHQEMVMIENKGQGSNPTVLFNGVIKIPKGYVRNGPNDRLEVSVLCPALDTTQCFQAHYKEFR